MSRPTVLDPPKPGNLAITPTPETARRSVLRTAEGKPCGWTVRSSALPGDVPERGYLRVGPHRGFASDAGVGTEDSSCPDSGPRTYDRARGDPAPCPHLRVPIHHGPRSQKTVAPHGRIGMHGHTRRDDATTLDRGDARDVCERMYGREELSSKAPQGVGNPQPGGVVRDRHYNVYRLDREHALEHLDVPKNRIPPHSLRDRRVGVVVKPQHAISQPTRQQNVQRDPSVAASPYYGDSHLFIEDQSLYFYFRFRYAGSGFGLSYLPLPPTEIPPGAPGSLAPLLVRCSCNNVMRSPAGATLYWGTRLAKRTFEGVTEKEITRRESSAARHLKFQYLEASFPAIHRDTPASGVYVSCFRRYDCSVEYPGTPDLDRPLDIGMERPRPYVRGQGPYQVMHLTNLPTPPYDPVLIRNLRSISSMTIVLVDKDQGIRLEKIQTLYYSFSPGTGETVG